MLLPRTEAPGLNTVIDSGKVMGKPLLLAFWTDGKNNFVNFTRGFSPGGRPWRAAAPYIGIILLGSRRPRQVMECQSKGASGHVTGACRGKALTGPWST